jgi:ParB family chromosome partitioning protein
MARKGLLMGLGDKPSTDSAVVATPPQQRLAVSQRGAAGSIVRSMQQIGDRAAEIEAQLTAGDRIIQLDPQLVDDLSFRDRMIVENDERYAQLRQAIEERGQESPILVRPHPTESGRYQIAFGRRRLRVANDLARPVLAVVRTMTDKDLVIAQGQENSARADLTFIERCRFAKSLEDHSHDRETIMQALSIDKTLLSRLLSVASKIPSDVIEQIGPAPSVGRPKWLELCDRFDQGAVDLAPLFADPAFASASSDARFEMALGYRGPSPDTSPAGTSPKAVALIKDSRGKDVVRINARERATTIQINRTLAPGFSEFVECRLQGLYEEFLKKKQLKR